MIRLFTLLLLCTSMLGCFPPTSKTTILYNAKVWSLCHEYGGFVINNFERDKGHEIYCGDGSIFKFSFEDFKKINGPLVEKYYVKFCKEEGHEDCEQNKNT